MKRLAALLLGLLIVVPVFSQDRYLELRANANAYERPDRESELVAELRPKRTAAGPVLLKMVSPQNKNGYYQIEVPDGSGRTGWVYKSYVRGYDRAPATEKGRRAEREASTETAQTFQPPCELPFPIKAERREIDNSCGIAGTGRKKPLSDDAQAQNRAKNNLCAQGPVTDLELKDLVRLQKIVDDDLQLKYGNTTPPQDRTVLRRLIKIGGRDIGEGSLVRYSGYVNHPRNSNVSKGETVNCNKSGAANNDIHIDVLKDPEDHVCSSVTVEIIPHYRPKMYNVNYIKEIQDKPFRFTGQLFFDGAHKPCKTPKGPAGHPSRISVWEIHPVYAIEVCKFRDIKKCRTGDDSAWLPLQDAVNEVHEEDDD